MLIVIGVRTEYVICAMERSRRSHHDHIRPDHLYMGAVAVLSVFGRVEVSA